MKTLVIWNPPGEHSVSLIVASEAALEKVALFRLKSYPHAGLLYQNRASPTHGLRLQADDPGAGLLSVRLEPYAELIAFRHPTSFNYLYTRQEAGSEHIEELYWSAASSAIPGQFHVAEAEVVFNPLVTQLVEWERSNIDLLSGVHLASLLANHDGHHIRIFRALIILIDKRSLLSMLPLLADQINYGQIFPDLRRLFGAGDDPFPLNTRIQLSGMLPRQGWSVGDHTYGRPMIIEEQAANLTVGKYCSIAAFSAIVLGNHTTDTATTYPFAMLADYWPQARPRIGLVDHVGRDVWIGSDVWIGLGAIILPGTTVGHGAVIAANAVARGTVPPYAIVAGNPGKVIRFRFSPDTIARLLEVAWWEWPDHKVDRFIPLLLDPDINRFLQAAEADRRLTTAGQNIALGRPAQQSSVFPWPMPRTAKEDAAGLVSGRLTGGYQNHTDLEHSPWWQVDLGPGAEIDEVRIHNRLDPETADRSNLLCIMSSDDGVDWNKQLDHRGQQPFGGIDGRPLVWRPDGRPLRARFIRIELDGLNYFHLDQVEVFGLAQT